MLQVPSVISVSPEVMSGTPVFEGTRVPAETLLEYLKAGDSVDDFIDGFPTVSKQQAVDLLEALSQQLISLSA